MSQPGLDRQPDVSSPHTTPTPGDAGTGADAVLLRAVLLAVPDLVHVIDLSTPSETWSAPMVQGLLGFPVGGPPGRGDEAAGVPVEPDDLVRLGAWTRRVRELTDGSVAEVRVRHLHADGDVRWVLHRAVPLLRDSVGALVRALGTARDVTEEVELRSRLSRVALHDGLTGLPNRDLLMDRLDSALRRHTRSGQVVPVLFCDLDGFKDVNDTAGHATGDAVLVATARRQVTALRPQDTVARVGGDEFVIVLETVDPGGDPASAEPQVVGETLAIVERLVTILREPVVVRGDGAASTHTVSASVGVAFAAPGSRPDQVLREADSAMYRAKAAGKDRYAVFDSSDRARTGERGHVERTLRAALGPAPDSEDRPPSSGGPQTPALSVAYQPVFDLSGMRLIGVEALARLTDGYGLALPPESFIAVAEQSGLIARLGRDVLSTACRDLAAWHDRFPAWRHLGVAVNLSARQAGLVDLVDLVAGALGDSGIAPSLLTLELTETSLLEASRTTVTALNALHALGVQLAIDDFGTGYASMSYLAQLPVSSVKVDRSFTTGLPHDPTCRVIVRTIATLARDLGLSCVVEGIETPEQLHALPAGVHGQGFLLGRPVTAPQLGALLASSTGAAAPPAGPEPPAPRAATSAVSWQRGLDIPPRRPRAAGRYRTALTIDREAAADQREDTADRRDRLADRRDVLADRREQTGVRHELDLEALFAQAQHRDQLAEVRDRQARDRDGAARRRDDVAGDGRGDRFSASGDRVHARMDRLSGARDRDAAASDRETLLEQASSLRAEHQASSLSRTRAQATRASTSALRRTTVPGGSAADGS